MSLKLLKNLILAIGINMILFNGVSAEKKKDHLLFTIVPASQNSIKTVIFDIGDVLFTSSRKQQARLLMLMALRHPSLMYTLLTKNMKSELFAMLHNVPAQTQQPDMMMFHQGQQLPPIMADWMTGRSNSEIIAATLAYLATSAHTQHEKKLFSKIIQFMFHPEQFVQALQPIEWMTTLAHTFKAHGYKLYILSNWDHESFPLLHEKNQGFFNMFDGIMISGTEGMGKPNPQFYTNLLQKYDLKPEECIFIDDEKHNIQAACDLGIHGILNDEFNSVCLQLKNLGILEFTKQ